MTIMIQVLEQVYSPTTPWQQRKYAFIDADHIVAMRLDGQSGVWLDVTKQGESHRLATTASPEESIYFLLRIFGTIAECRQNGGSWLIGHDGIAATSIHAAKFPHS
ncbi:hypothetical protein ERC79_19700 [Rhodococcus sp. ABRD24]|uniref:hypothetical protein n=1 Tax=Rhodococcus sp. ABRD24 TaxID=2507582 RepID=UPI00103BEA26|nr:hypothetical protein [Rhodococcus sp. ABRD24]QBJ97920.1 hypothetical protein ERC79_19700 [Rhodococcus sp. ABRD24]